MEKATKEQQEKLVNYAKENQDFARTWMRLHTPLNATSLPGRNDICPYCDSGKKFKNCECYKTHTKEYKNKFYID